MIKYSKPKICGSSRITLRYDKVRDANRLVSCRVLSYKNCGLIFLEEKVKQKELDIYYKSGKFFGTYSPNLKKTGSSESRNYYQIKKPLQEARFNMLKDYFSSDAEVLEIGCATGSF